MAYWYLNENNLSEVENILNALNSKINTEIDDVDALKNRITGVFGPELTDNGNSLMVSARTNLGFAQTKIIRSLDLINQIRALQKDIEAGTNEKITLDSSQYSKVLNYFKDYSEYISSTVADTNLMPISRSTIKPSGIISKVTVDDAALLQTSAVIATGGITGIALTPDSAMGTVNNPIGETDVKPIVPKPVTDNDNVIEVVEKPNGETDVKPVVEQPTTNNVSNEPQPVVNKPQEISTNVEPKPVVEQKPQPVVNNTASNNISSSNSSTNITPNKNESAANTQTNTTSDTKVTSITDESITGSTTDLFEIEDENLNTATKNVGKNTSTGGSGIGVVAAGLGAAAAVGVGVKVYKDRKENNEFDLNEDRPTNDNKYWTDEESRVIHSEKDEFVEDNIPTEPEKYTASSNNIEIDEDINNDTWSMPEQVEETSIIEN